MAMLEDATARGEQSPRLRLVLGLAQDAIGQQAAAISNLRTAKNLYDDMAVMTEQLALDPNAREWHRWACHHLGRLLYQHDGDLNEAVASLRAAAAYAPDDVRTDFHLAHAIRTLVERESLVDVAAMLHRYLNGGAPLGQVSNVQEQLRALEGR